MSTPSSGKPRRRSALTWDEETIALHDKDRGTRQKIDEPDTPYTTYTPNDDLSDDRFSLQGPPGLARGISAEEANAGGAHGGEHPRSPDEADAKGAEAKSLYTNLTDFSDKLQRAASEELVTPGKEEEREQQFKQARANHYNEFERLKAWRAAHRDDDDDDEEDDEDEEDDGD